MGMYDEVQCDAPLPDAYDCREILFQTKSFPEPGLQRYKITCAGRLVNSRGKDIEPDGYVTFYTTDREADRCDSRGMPGWREYRARFVSGQLQGIARVEDKPVDQTYYGLASFKWFDTPSVSFEEPAEP